MGQYRYGVTLGVDEEILGLHKAIGIWYNKIQTEEEDE